jgi:hypothetical protein
MVSALAPWCSVSGAVMSRHLRDLGNININRHKRTKLELIATVQRAHGDHRERHVILTERGAAGVRQMIVAMKEKTPLRRPMPRAALV